MAGRIYRGYDKEPQQRGSVITITKPSTFTAQDAPGSDQDIEADSLSITLSEWKEVKFALTDKELTYTGQQIIDQHIRPAAYAIADAIDLKLASLYKFVPWYTGAAGTTPDGVDDITNARQVMFDNNVPLGDPAMLHMMINGAAENKFLQLQAFSQFQGAGPVGVDTQQRGSLGYKYGMEIFANQNTQSHTSGTASTGTLALVGAHAKGSSAVQLDAGTVTGTLVEGDSFVIAGNTQRYAVVGGPYTAAGNAFANVAVTPKLVQNYSDNAVVTVALQNGVRNLAFHRNFAALAMAPLSTLGNGLGVEMATIADPITQLALRARIWYDANNSKLKVGLDVLFGFKVLDPNLGVNVLG